MPWLMSKIYDGFMAQTEEACLRDWRRELLAAAEGRVLEIGAGTGANLEFYPDAVSELVVTEPDRHMRTMLQKRFGDVEVVDALAEDLPFEDASFDVVVSTLVLCSVHSQGEALSEIRRVLRPGGKLLFMEHVVSSKESRRKWQRRVEPVWSWAADNCHLTRDTAGAIEAAGFEFVELENQSMRKALSVLRESIRGVAIKPSKAGAP